MPPEGKTGTHGQGRQVEGRSCERARNPVGEPAPAVGRLVPGVGVTAVQIVDWSAPVERGLWYGAVAMAIVFAVRARRRLLAAAATNAWERALSARAEATWLFAILLLAALLRTVGWDAGLTAPYWSVQSSMLNAAEILDRRDWWTWFRTLLTTYQVTVLPGSAIMMPVAVGLQWLLGPSIHLPVLVGAIFGTLTVAFGWWLGRTLESRVFGLVFAALLAVSPLQVVWSRNGGLFIGSGTQVLLALAVGTAAGRHGSVFLGAIAGLVAWTTVYHYYAARIAIPLAFVAIVVGGHVGAIARRRIMVVLLSGVAAFAVAYATIRPPGVVSVFWPSYGGYIGTRGEQSLREMVGRNVETAAREVPTALRAYFLERRTEVHRDRAVGPATSERWGMESGGLVLAPIAMLGLLGLGMCAVAPRRRVLWAMLLVGGLAVPMLSATTARRFIVFDAGWCGVAAYGAMALIDSRLCRSWSPRVALALGTAVYAMIATWSFATVVLLNRLLPPQHPTVIPFSESGFGDGRVCLACVRAGYRWQREIAERHVVVLFDSDLGRENRFCPGSLPLYGKLAALAAGSRASFVQFYAVLGNYDYEEPYIGALYRPGTRFSKYLAQKIDEAGGRDIVWDFEQPTLWERWLAERLEAAGGTRRHVDSPQLASYVPSDDTPFVVVTPWAKRKAAFDVIRRLEHRGAPRPSPCVDVPPVSWRPSADPVVALSALDEAEPRWIVASFNEVLYDDRRIPAGGTVAIGSSKAPESVDVLTGNGTRLVDAVGGGVPPSSMPLDPPRAIGADCAAFVANRWWVIDPISGGGSAIPGGAVNVPAGRWIGITAWSATEIALASATQEVVVFDVVRGSEVRRFPAAVWPSRRLAFGECSPIVAGADWFGTFNQPRGTLNVYARSGRPLGVVQLYGDSSVLSVYGRGAHLAVGGFHAFGTTTVRVDPACRIGG